MEKKTRKCEGKERKSDKWRGGGRKRAKKEVRVREGISYKEAKNIYMYERILE